MSGATGDGRGPFLRTDQNNEGQPHRFVRHRPKGPEGGTKRCELLGPTVTCMSMSCCGRAEHVLAAVSGNLECNLLDIGGSEVTPNREDTEPLHALASSIRVATNIETNQPRDLLAPSMEANC